MQASEVPEKLRLVLDTRCRRFAAVVLLARLLRDAGEGLGMATSAVITGAARWLRLSPAESVLLFLASELPRRVRMPWEQYGSPDQPSQASCLSTTGFSFRICI
ncbi:hypothetical protein DIPPA_30065 [Diplonema papillatum]|nr:hypothetical protein DIPPA_30065 [Diplonema papillatum]